MFQIDTDKSQNILTIVYSGRVDPEEAEGCADEVKERVGEVGREFTLLTDLSELEEMAAACAPYIRRTMDVFARHDLKRVIRIIPDPQKDIGLSIMSLFHYPRQVQIITCQSRAEAAELLKT